MDEYWEITHERAVATQAVWGMKPAFELNKLTKTQHATLSDSFEGLVQTRDDRENDLTEALAAKHTVFAKLVSVVTRTPGLIDGTLDDDDELKEQLDPIYAIDPDASENSTLRRCRGAGCLSRIPRCSNRTQRSSSRTSWSSGQPRRCFSESSPCPAGRMRCSSRKPGCARHTPRSIRGNSFFSTPSPRPSG